MTKLAQIYLGNVLHHPELSDRVQQAQTARHCLDVMLTHVDNSKSRIYAQSQQGISVGLIKERDQVLVEGDVFMTEDSELVLVHLEAQKLMVIRFPDGVIGHELDLMHLGHTLGNHHWPILVSEDRIYVQQAADWEVMENTIQHFDIPGLEISYETRSPHQVLTFSHHSHP